MRDALLAWGVVDEATPSAFPAMSGAARRHVTTDERRELVLRAYHDPEVRHPDPYGRDHVEGRLAGPCRLVVDTESGVVCTAYFLAEQDRDARSLLGDQPRSLPRARGGGAGSRGPSDYRDFVAMLREEGCVITVARGSKHNVVHLPDGRKVQISSTPSDYRTLPNEVARLRRLGLKLTKF